MVVRARTLFALVLSLALAACGREDEGPLRVAVIGDEASLFAEGLRLSEGAQHVRAATETGLVTLDAEGGIVPGLADRWIVTEDARSYIFRLRDGEWPDGSELTAESARNELRDVIRRLEGTSLGLDLAPIEEIRAMAGRVVEIRLSTPVPDFLRLLAQPELGLSRGEGASGPMAIEEGEAGAVLAFKPPEERGLPMVEDWEDYVRRIQIQPMPMDRAIEAFDDGAVDVVLGGRIGSLPLADPGPLSRGTLRLDPAIGLFGLQVRRARGLLATEDGREAIAMAIDRAALLEPFGVGGWTPTTRVVGPGLPGPAATGERWTDMTIEERRALAARRVAQWQSANAEGETAGENAQAGVRLSVAMGSEPGLDLLYGELARQLAEIGVVLDRVASGETADFELVDRTARYAAPRWFINQFACSLERGLCVDGVDALSQVANQLPDPEMRTQMLAQAENELTKANVYIPFGAPLRWSLVRSNVEGFAANVWAFHPLPPMATLPR